MNTKKQTKEQKNPVSKRSVPQFLSSSVPQLLGIFAAILLMGAGCFGGGGGVNPNTDGGIWLSSDGGASFVQSNIVPRADGIGSASGASVTTIVADPSDPKALYMGTQANGVLYSYDSGLSWQQSQDERARTGLVSAIAIDPTNKCRIYIAKGDRILRSEDCARTFDAEVFVEGKQGVIVQELQVDWFTPDHVYAITSDNTIVKSVNRGASWATIFRGNRPMTDLMISRFDSRVVLASLDGSGVARSVDAGANWVHDATVFDQWRDARRIFSLDQDAKGGTILASSMHGLLRSTDQGVTWEALSLLTAPGEVTIAAAAIDPVVPTHLVYTVGNNYYTSPDGGASWSVVKIPTNRALSDIHFHRQNSSIIYLGSQRVQ